MFYDIERTCDLSLSVSSNGYTYLNGLFHSLIRVIFNDGLRNWKVVAYAGLMLQSADSNISLYKYFSHIILRKYVTIRA